MNHLEEIRSKISIEELVGSYVQLKKAGRNFRGLCPFHGEKTPSFMVSPEKQIAYCFGCNQGGDIFKFTQLVESCDFPEALKMLADKAGVTLPKTSPKESNKRFKTVEINEIAVNFFQEELEKNEKYKKYFLDRGLTAPTIKEFQLGYAPDSFNALKTRLKEKGVTDREMLDAGVVNQKDMADQNTYDRFRHRLIFPIYDHQKNPVAFGGRIIDQGEPKYLNSPDTPAYNKSMVLYGLHLAKDAVKEKDMAIFVEGYMDVIASHQAGVKNVIATSGTAMTEQQLKLIKRYTKNIALAFDQDSAGMEATMRAIELAELAELNIKIVQIGEKDPDECIKEDPDTWIKATENPVSVMDFYFAYANSKHDKETMEGKKGIMSIILPIIKLIPSEVEQGAHLNRLSVEIKTDVKLLWNDLNKTQTQKTYAPEKGQVVAEAKPLSYNREQYLLGFILKFPEFYKIVAENLIENIGADPVTETFYKTMKSVYTLEGPLDVDALKAALEAGEREKVDIYSLLIDEKYPDFSEEAAEKEIRSLVRSINQKNIKQVQKQVELSIRGANTAEEKTQLLNKYNEILKLATKVN